MSSPVPPQGPFGNPGNRPPQPMPGGYPQAPQGPAQQRPAHPHAQPPRHPAGGAQYQVPQQLPQPQQWRHPAGGAQYQGPQQGRPQGFPPQQQFGGAPALVITTKYFVTAWFFAFCKPTIAIDGREAPGVWGPNPIPLAPGRHHVHVHVPYIFPTRCGPAEAVIDVVPGRTVALNYKAPVWSFSKGSLGEGEQKYNGVGILIGVVAVPFVLVFLMTLLLIAVG